MTGVAVAGVRRDVRLLFFAPRHIADRRAGCGARLRFHHQLCGHTDRRARLATGIRGERADGGRWVSRWRLPFRASLHDPYSAGAMLTDVLERSRTGTGTHKHTLVARWLPWRHDRGGSRRHARTLDLRSVTGFMSVFCVYTARCGRSARTWDSTCPCRIEQHTQRQQGSVAGIGVASASWHCACFIRTCVLTTASTWANETNRQCVHGL